ncbi:hypothetical protein DFJ58DRAFT_23271 [Suillus subalutaceus]|uniref:uncharacterized protein n=1 Tax=Suillus subalutaceus TaxID=48586 RepID=UPI001B87401D|nr:uncharacterized protein DFJ58DRAFT_23271 [Suillus subalutaceus]KAG1870743.1 hypothetical protein DFJ58DRAFT_23271 [Suillus subalutaceus]
MLVLPAHSIRSGPLLVGFALNTILYGVLVTSVLLYYSSFKSDGARIRLLVSALLLLCTFNVVLEYVFLNDTLIVNFGDQYTLSRANWVFSLLPGITGVISTLVQFFFAWRIRILTSNFWLVGIIVFLASAAFLCGIGTTIAINMVPVFTQFDRFEIVFVIGLASSTLDNLLITGLLVRSLREHKTGFMDTDHIIKKIIRVVLQTGLLTAIWALVDLAVYVALTDGMHLVFNQSLAQFYTISLMSTLITRPRDRAYADFTVVNGEQPERTDAQIPLEYRNIYRRRNSELVFDVVSLKKFDTVHGATDTQQ